MATMVLKDMVICPECGAKMFPCAFDKEARVIGYRCSAKACGAEKSYGFDEVKLAEGERFHFVCLNDDGEVTWKCHEHGYCDNDIENMLDEDFTKFERTCCIWGRDEDEIELDVEYAHNEGREMIQKILDAIGEDCVADLADDMLYDNSPDLFDGDYVEAFVAEAICSSDGVDAFISQMMFRIYDLFEISLNENGEVED